MFSGTITLPAGSPRPASYSSRQQDDGVKAASRKEEARAREAKMRVGSASRIVDSVI
jgi:hypothetical protein